MYFAANDKSLTQISEQKSGGCMVPELLNLVVIGTNSFPSSVYGVNPQAGSLMVLT